jgi:hypothetical protein
MVHLNNDGTPIEEPSLDGNTRKFTIISNLSRPTDDIIDFDTPSVPPDNAYDIHDYYYVKVDHNGFPKTEYGDPIPTRDEFDEMLKELEKQYMNSIFSKAISSVANAMTKSVQDKGVEYPDDFEEESDTKLIDSVRTISQKFTEVATAEAQAKADDEAQAKMVAEAQAKMVADQISKSVNSIATQFTEAQASVDAELARVDAETKAEEQAKAEAEQMTSSVKLVAKQFSDAQAKIDAELEAKAELERTSSVKLVDEDEKQANAEQAPEITDEDRSEQIKKEFYDAEAKRDKDLEEEKKKSENILKKNREAKTAKKMSDAIVAVVKSFTSILNSTPDENDTPPPVDDTPPPANDTIKRLQTIKGGVYKPLDVDKFTGKSDNVRFQNDLKKFVETTNEKLWADPIFVQLNGLTLENFTSFYKISENGLVLRNFAELIAIDITPLHVITTGNDQYTDCINTIFNTLNVHNNSIHQYLEIISPDNDYFKTNHMGSKFCHLFELLKYMRIIANTGMTTSANEPTFAVYTYLQRYMQIITAKLLARTNVSLSLSSNSETALKEYISKQSKANLLSYLKVSNQGKNPKLINGRFVMSFDKPAESDPTYMKLTYNTSPIATVFNKNGIPERRIVDGPTTTYLFGKYDQILLPYKSYTQNTLSTTNQTDAQKIMDDIKDKLDDNLDDNLSLFFIGYGKSGSGKTYTLIGEEKNKNYGLLIHLYMKIKEKKTKQVTSITLQSTNFYKGSVPNDDGLVTITSDSYDDLLNRLTSIIKGESQDKRGKRQVHATTNNPVSSRSHVLIHIKFTMNNGKVINLFVGDFAGVENRFVLDELKFGITERQFLKIREDLENPQYYYLKNIDSEVIKRLVSEKPILVGGITPVGGLQSGIPRLKLDASKSNKSKEVRSTVPPASKPPTTFSTTPRFKEKSKTDLLDYTDDNKPSAPLPDEARGKVPVVEKEVLAVDPEAILKGLCMKHYQECIDADIDADETPEIEFMREYVKYRSLFDRLKLNKADDDDKNTLGVKRQAIILRACAEAKSNSNFVDILKKCNEDIKNKIEGKPNCKATGTSTAVTQAETEFLFRFVSPETDNISQKTKDTLMSICSGLNELYKINNSGMQYDGYPLNMYIDKKYSENRNEYIEASIIKLFTHINELMINKYDKYIPFLYIHEIIKKRNTEGEYINESLKVLRADVRCVLEKREKKSLYYTPSIEHDCLGEYCPTLNACFDVIPSEAPCNFGDIFKKINEFDPLFESNGIISVFCLLNVTFDSKLEPPNVPYIDINRFSQTWDKINNLGFISPHNAERITIESIKRLKSGIRRWRSEITDYRTTVSTGANAFYIKISGILKEIDRLTKDRKYRLETKFTTAMKYDFLTNKHKVTNETKTKNNRSTNPPKNVQEDFHNRETKNMLDTLTPIFIKVNEAIEEMRTSIITNNKKSYAELGIAIKAEYEAMTQFIESHKSLDAIINLQRSKWYIDLVTDWEKIDWERVEYRTTEEGDQDETYRPLTADMNLFIDKINEYNASSDIGTIAFLDNFAKSNTTNYICNTRDISKKLKGTTGNEKYASKYITQ